MDPPVAVSLNPRQDSDSADPSYVLGPLIVSSAVAWAIWGMFTLHFVLFVREVVRRRARRLRQAGQTSAPARLDWFGRRRRRQAEEEERMRREINPWTTSFAAPSISAYPSQARQTTNVHPRQHTRHRSTKSALSSSQDPYSPTSAGDQDSHSVLLPSHEPPASDNAPSSSLWIILLASTVYILVLLRSVLSTVQFWRVAVQGWNSGSVEDHTWTGAMVADLTSPIVFMLVSAYFIYSLFFTDTLSSSPHSSQNHTLRPLSLLKHKMSSVSKVEYPACSPTSTAPTASRPGSAAGWKLAGLGSIAGAAASGSASARRAGVNAPAGPARPRGWDIVQPVLLVLAALVVGACGIVETARSSSTSMKTSTPLDAPSLIWYAGLFAFDFVLCFLLSRQLCFTGLWERSSWPTLAAQALFEAGGAQLLVALLSMVLVVVWRADKPESTLPFVVPCVLPSFSAFSALAHAARLGRMSYWCSNSGYSRYGASARDLDHSRRLRRTSSRNSDIPKFELADIEMGGVRSSRDAYEEKEIRPGANSSVVNLVSRPSYPRERVVDLAAAQTATSSNSNTFSSDGSGSRQERTEDMVKQAMNLSEEREKEHERREAEAKLTGLVLERDTSGSGSGAAGAIEVARNGKATSVMSGVSGGSAVTSLELPVFRKGRDRYSRYVNGYGYEHDWDEESDIDVQSDVLTFLTSEDEGGVWDYGFSNMEREKEREERATNLAAAAAYGSNSVAGPSTLPTGTMSGTRRLTTMGRRISNRFSNAYPPASSVDLGEYDEAAEEADTVSVLSHASRRSSRSRRRSRRSFHQFPPSHPHAQRPLPVRRLLPVPPSSSTQDSQAQAAPSNHPYLYSRTQPSTRASSVDSLPTPYFAPGSPAGSVLVISRSAAPEPSITEPSIYHAASVAATRASTGSAFSTFTYTYPRPFQLPDLDIDLASGEPLGLESAMDALPGSAFGGAMSSTAMSGTSPPAAPQSPHPYGVVSDTDLPPPEPTRRRWNVHPLKRFAEMGRLKW